MPRAWGAACGIGGLAWMLAALGRLGAMDPGDRELDLTARTTPAWQTCASAQGDLYRSGALTLPVLAVPAGSTTASLQLLAWRLPWEPSPAAPGAGGTHATTVPTQARTDLALRLASGLGQVLGRGMAVEVVLRASRVRADAGATSAWQRSLGDVESALLVELSSDERWALALAAGTLTPLTGTPSPDWLQDHGRRGAGGNSALGEVRLGSNLGAVALQGRSRLTWTPQGENRLDGGSDDGVVHDRFQGWESVLGVEWRVSPCWACALEGAWQRWRWRGTLPGGADLHLDRASAPVLGSVSASLAGLPGPQLQLVAGGDCGGHQRMSVRQRLVGGIILSEWW